nr:phage tail protein [Bradyrhizobium symbiodeficiens]
MNMMSPNTAETALEAGGAAKGVAIAVVCENRDDSGQGRVRVTYPWHVTPHQSHWARIASPMAGKKRGLYLMPEIGDEVLVAFERGDVRFPYVLGSLWNGKEQAPQTNGDGRNDIRMLQTRSGHKLTFDDGARGVVRLELSDGKKLEFDDQGIKLDDGNGNSLIIQSTGGQMTIKAATKLSISAPTVEINASLSLNATAGGVTKINGTPVMINC